MQQAYRAAKIATKDEHLIKKVLDTFGEKIKDIPLENTPPETGKLIYKIVSEITGIKDPYAQIKKENIQEALELYSALKLIVNESNDRLLMAIRIAIAGNVIDFGVNKTFDMERDIETIIQQNFSVFDYKLFLDKLSASKSILYLGDNAGESVFDKILIEELNKPVVYVVRETPIINDCTIHDAIDSGLDEVAEIISSGSTAPATIIKLCNAEFIKKYNSAELIISKGQGNYEGLSCSDKPVFFMLKVKCPVIANDLQVEENDIVLKGININ